MSENVQTIPADKNFRGNVAYNAGIVVMECWINRKCPFTKTQAFNDTLVFNSETVKNYPDTFHSLVTSVPGTEGIFLHPAYPYRHNFIEGKIINTADPLPADASALPIAPPSPSYLDYRDHQTWVITPSIFSTTYLNPSKYNNDPASSNAPCSSLARWAYNYVNNPSKLAADTPEQNIQMPMQIAAESCGGAGVHWRVEKKTELFDGEDVFLEFHKKAISTDIQTASGAATQVFNASFTSYAGLDIRNTTDVLFAPYDIQWKKRNGIADPNNNQTQEPSNTKAFDFTDQAYYVIEFGLNDSEHNYFIIITQRAEPRCVRVDADGICWKVSSYSDSNVQNNSGDGGNTLMGSDLINADSFRMSVRNHLGMLIVDFSGPGFSAKPWVITREDVILGTSGPTTVKVNMFTKGKMSIWGGNILSGFLFGPIQYWQPDTNAGVKFFLPPDAPKDNAPGAAGGVTQVSKFTLPALGAHNSVKLTSDDGTVEGPYGATAGVGPGLLFTQDAQRYQEIINGSTGPIKVGNFFGGPPIRGDSPGSTHSLIKLTMADVQSDAATRSTMFRVATEMKAGSHTFSNPTWSLKKCKTPILTIARLVSEPANVYRWGGSGFECSEHVMQFSDSWSATDFTHIDHTGSIRFLIQPGATYHHDHTSDIYSLMDKTFYIEVLVGYRDCNYSRIPNLFHVFTGICQGGTVTYENGKRYMDCQILDYTKVLQDVLFFNSPFFDGVRSMNAVDTILKIAGFAFSNAASGDPGYLVTQAAAPNAPDLFTAVGLDGRPVSAKRWVIPSGYSILLQPQFKFSDGDKLLDGIMKIAQREGKVFFFDAFGVAHYEDYLDAVQQGLVGAGTTPPLWKYISSNNPSLGPGQLIFNMATVQRDVSSVYNHIKILTNTPDFTPIFGDDIDWSSYDDPTTEGFVGYLKTLYQAEGSFGSLESLQNIVQYYSAMRRPPIVAKFESYGLPVRALDIIQLDGQLLRVMRVDSNIDAQKNVWWQTFECEWLLPILNPITFGGNTPAGP